MKYKVFIILEIKVTLISYSLSKAASKAAENNGLITLISPPLAVPWPGWGMGQTNDCFQCKQQLPEVVRLSFPLVYNALDQRMCQICLQPK